jgi:hypothetical protein
MLACAQRRGVDVQAVLGQIGLGPDALEDVDLRMPESLLFRAWEIVVPQVGDPAFGLRVAEESELGAYDVLDYSLYYSRSVREGLDRFTRFRRILNDSLAVDLAIVDGEARLRRTVPSTPPEDQDLVFAGLLLRLRQMSGVDLSPREVRFEHPAPADLAPWLELFRCRVSFGTAVSVLVLSARDLDLPARTSAPALVRVLERHARDLLARLPSGATFSDRVRHSVARSLSGGPPSLRATAKALHASPRTVQRRLAAEARCGTWSPMRAMPPRGRGG